MPRYPSKSLEVEPYRSEPIAEYAAEVPTPVSGCLGILGRESWDRPASLWDRMRSIDDPMKKLAPCYSELSNLAIGWFPPVASRKSKNTRKHELLVFLVVLMYSRVIMQP